MMEEVKYESPAICKYINVQDVYKLPGSELCAQLLRSYGKMHIRNI